MATKTPTPVEERDALAAEAVLLVAAISARQTELRSGFFRWARTVFDRLASEDFYRYGRFIGQVSPRLQAVRQSYANAYAAYAARIIPVTRALAELEATYDLPRLTLDNPRRYASATPTRPLRARPVKVSFDPRADRGITLADEVDEITGRYRWLASQGEDEEAARAAAWDRLERLFDSDIQEAGIDAIKAAELEAEAMFVNLELSQPDADLVDDPEPSNQANVTIKKKSGRRRKVSRSATEWRRVLHPEKSQGGPCLLCTLASTRSYWVDDLQPIHDGCHCEAVPVVNGTTIADGMNEAAKADTETPA